MHIEALYEEFLSYLDLERGYSPLTITAYRSDFYQFLVHLDDLALSRSLDSVERHVLRQYIARMREQGMAATTIARRLNSLRSFWKHLRDNGYAECDPFLRISVPKRPRSLPVHLSADECASLLEGSLRQPSVFLAFRDRAILESTCLHRDEERGVAGVATGVGRPEGEEAPHRGRKGTEDSCAPAPQASFGRVEGLAGASSPVPP